MSTQRDAEFLAFVTSSRSELRRIAYLMCRDWHQAEDLTQDTLVSIYASWESIADTGALMPYARKVLLRKVIDDSRRPWRRHRVGELPELAAQPDGDVPYDERQVLLAALSKLPAGRRACIVLRYFEDLSVAETAGVLGCSEGNVKSQTARGITELRRLLDAAGITYLGLMDGVLT